MCSYFRIMKMSTIFMLVLLSINASVKGSEISESPNQQLIEAAENGNTEKVKNFLQNYAGDTNEMRVDINNAFLKAAENGHNDIVEILIQNDANINARDEYGYTALINAVLNGHKKVVKTIIQNNDNNINAKTDDGMTALSAAVNDDKEIFDIILQTTG